MGKIWQTLSSKIIYKNPWWSYRLETYRLPNGEEGEYHYVYTNGSSMVIPLADNGEILMVRQYRYLNQRHSIEFPCGGLEEGLGYRENAEKELIEETGFAAKKWQEAGRFNPYNGVSCEMCRVYLATELSPRAGKTDPTEEIEVLRVAPSKIDEMIQKNQIWDGMSIAAWTLGKPRLGS